MTEQRTCTLVRAEIEKIRRTLGDLEQEIHDLEKAEALEIAARFATVVVTDTIAARFDAASTKAMVDVGITHMVDAAGNAFLAYTIKTSKHILAQKTRNPANLVSWETLTKTQQFFICKSEFQNSIEARQYAKIVLTETWAERTE